MREAGGALLVGAGERERAFGALAGDGDGHEILVAPVAADNALEIMQRSVDVSPAATIVAVLVGGSLLGVLGALLAIPIAAAVQLVMLEVIIPRQDAA